MSGVGTDFIDYAKPEEKQKVINLIVTQLYIAYVKGYDTIVLGAFGCGAFQNPPQSVAKIYQDVIKASFKGAFKKIVFAILDDPLSKSVHNPTGNFKPFEICFRAS